MFRKEGWGIYAFDWRCCLGIIEKKKWVRLWEKIGFALCNSQKSFLSYPTPNVTQVIASKKHQNCWTPAIQSDHMKINIDAVVNMNREASLYRLTWKHPNICYKFYGSLDLTKDGWSLLSCLGHVDNKGPLLFKKWYLRLTAF